MQTVTLAEGTGTSSTLPTETVALLARLIGFDTTSDRSNLAAIGFITDYLDNQGVPYRLSYDESGEKANIHAVIGRPGPGGLALSGHIDTVPVDGQRWTSDPFTLREADGRLYGRGTADMKGFVASCLAAIPDIKAAELARPVHLFISYDEEISCNGARRLIEDMADSGWKPDLCLVGEPSLLSPITGHKGRLAMRVTVRGRAGHSATPARGVNAVQAAARAIAWVAAEERRFSVAGPFVPGFDPPHSTCQVGRMGGGTGINIIPDLAWFEMEWRTVPGDDFFAEVERFRTFVATEIEPAMTDVDTETGFDFAVLNWIPGLSLPEDHALADKVRQVTGRNSAGRVSYGTEAGLFQDAGIPSIVCGPGNINQAHQGDEWIAVSELAACDRFIRQMVERVCR
ncbi:acetylornithine deacetylase [Acidisoma cellulosilytica]|uniref:Acetylornithine deacetylase n=1 Tax=Acidisoma cellulosilyticum TaxID=2802395 RepID=A0A963YYN1_9PROT|nr:acetylornithine deacetylase [Acidisoma cellulosilyticum]MCB8879673.1 acetylornithine deacetylase [Acidisoma cellulosilyticum]